MTDKSHLDVPTIYGEWRQDETYDPARFDHKIRVVDPQGNATIRAVDRLTYERVREAAMFARLEAEN